MMKLIYESSDIKLHSSDGLSSLVGAGGARICLDDIHYDKTEGTVEIRMKRREMIGFTKSFFFGGRPIYSKPQIDTLLTIRDVAKMDMQIDERLVTECDSCFQVLFGLKIDGNELYLGSVEEISGVTLCHIFITVTRMNIECIDIGNPPL